MPAFVLNLFLRGQGALGCVLLFLPCLVFGNNTIDTISAGNADEWNQLSIKVWNKLSEVTNRVDKEKDPIQAAFLRERLRRLDSAKCILWRLVHSSQEFGLAHVKGSGPSSTTYSPGKRGRPGKIVFTIYANSPGNFIHEITHGSQFEHGAIVYTRDGKRTFGNNVFSEAEAYRQEFAYDSSEIGKLTPLARPTSFEAVNADWVRSLQTLDSNGEPYYVYDNFLFGRDSISMHSDTTALRISYRDSTRWKLNDWLCPLTDPVKFIFTESNDYSCPPTQITGYRPFAPNHAIIPTPISIADSSILNVGVCTPEVMPSATFITPSR
jgi:hypothetical protein